MADEDRRLKTYEDGVREGQIAALELIAARHDNRFEALENRINAVERIQWGILGAITLIEILPNLTAVLAL